MQRNVIADGAKCADGPRPRVHGKFLFVGDEAFYVRGVTYGPFRPDAAGCEYHAETVERDFAAIAATGANAVRTYTVPPHWLLDTALRHGLRVMVGLPWEQHVTFLDERRGDDIELRVRAGVRACARHPALLCYAIGNEIPAPIVRWHGQEAVEAFLDRLYRAAKAEDPDGLVTYVNYPSTEYLRPRVDFLSFNVYLESEERLDAYLARLHNLADGRPLVMAEIGLDSRRNGDEAQARVLDWQVRTTFASGCAGAFVFAWTDEWHRGGHDIDDWDFGLTTRNRRPKPALSAVAHAFADVPFSRAGTWPRVSVAVCTHNGARTLRECLQAVLAQNYPDFEVIIVDDGSTDESPAIASTVTATHHDVRLIRTENRGLSSARNTALAAATGEVIAYADDDAAPDPYWLTYLAATFRSTSYVGVGGPNLPVPTDGPVADCIAHAPGGPIHVLLTDREAEHVPGCNMAFRVEALRTVGGFDPQFRVAGDDVDICWQMQARGWRIGFHPAAVVWHHRRRSVHAYWRQQLGYGKAEALLERKWPEKYNEVGHIPWAGRIYASYLAERLTFRGRIYHGTWGSALFQSIYAPAPSALASLVMMPEWYMIIVGLAALSAAGTLWPPLLFVAPLFVSAVGALVVHAGRSAAVVEFPSRPQTHRSKFKRWALTAVLHLLQPMARLIGRLREGLSPWRYGTPGVIAQTRRHERHWSERWQSPEARALALETAIRAQRAVALRGGSFDRWDVEVRGGVLGGVRTLSTVEEHGGGRQLTKLRSWSHPSSAALAVSGLFALLSAGAALDGALSAALLLGAIAAIVVGRMLYECASAMTVVVRAVEWLRQAETAVAAKLETTTELETSRTVTAQADSVSREKVHGGRGRGRPARTTHEQWAG